ncbi:MAG: hypothetical protein R3A51_12960 [Nannocystaceae bacterium]
MTDSAGFTVRRVLVALDASTRDSGGIDPAALLAARLGAELAGLFIEDVNVSRLARLPAARHVQPGTGRLIHVDESTFRRELDSLVERLRARLASASDTAGVRWSYQIERSPVRAALLRAAEEADLLVIEVATLALERGLPREAERAAHACPRSLFLVQRGAPLDAITLVYGLTPARARTLEAARRLSRAGTPRLRVLIHGRTADELRAAEADLRAQIDVSEPWLSMIPVELTTLEQLARALQGLDAGTLVIGADDSLLCGSGPRRLFEAAPGNVLLVR